MNIKVDSEEFGKRQTRLIEELALNIKSRLEEMGLGADQELVESLVFDIGAILDGSREMELNGRQLKPFLMFADDDDGEELVSAGCGSFIHEVSGGVVSKIFGDEPSA
jgi:hypothetical protein